MPLYRPPGRDGVLEKARSRSLRTKKGGSFGSIWSQRIGKCPRFLSGGGGNRFPVVPHLAGKVAQNANHHFCRPIENRRADLRPFPPRAICPLGPGLGGGQKPKGLRGHPGRHDGLPGAGFRCTFAQQGRFGGFHVGSAVRMSPSGNARPRIYVWTAGMQAGRPGRPEPSRHSMRAAGILSFCQRVVRIVLEMHTHLRSHRACFTRSQGCHQMVPVPNFMQE